MTNQNETWVWNDISSNADDENPELWGFFEKYFESYKDMGFTEVSSGISQPAMFGHTDRVNIRWTIYRSETLELLAVHGCYLDDMNEQHPYILMVNPNHQRKGIGTMMANFAKDRYAEEFDRIGDAEVIFNNIKTTPAGASFLNKFGKQEYDKRNENV